MEHKKKAVTSGNATVFSIRNALFPSVKAAGLFDKGFDDVDEKHKHLFRASPEESGWDRVKLMFSKDEYGNRSTELMQVCSAAMMATVVGAGAGGYLGSQLAAQEFMKQSKVIKYATDIEKQRRLAAEMKMALLRKGIYWSWRTGLFTGTYLFIVRTVSVYRNKSSLLEYALAGGVVGTMFKFNAGLKRACTAGLMGSAVGAVAGGISLGFMWLTGSSVEEERYWRNRYKQHILSEIEEAPLQISSNQKNMERPADLTSDAFPPM